MRVKGESEKVGLKLSIPKTKSMASGPITSCQIGEKWKKWDFIFLGSKIHCGWWLKTWNLKNTSPWKESYDKPRQCIRKERDTLPTKIHIALTIWIFVGKLMFLLSNMLSRFVITFLSRSKHLLISWLQSPSAVIFSSVQSLSRVRLFATPWIAAC